MKFSTMEKLYHTYRGLLQDFLRTSEKYEVSRVRIADIAKIPAESKVLNFTRM